MSNTKNQNKELNKQVNPVFRIPVKYEKIELTNFTMKKELREDLYFRLGLFVIDWVVKKIDYLNDTAILVVRAREFNNEELLQYKVDQEIRNQRIVREQKELEKNWVTIEQDED